MQDSHDHGHLLDVRQVRAATGLRASTLRFYEQVGLISSAGRRGGQRVFEGSVLDRLAFIAQGRQHGFTLAEIRDAASAQEDDPRRWRELLAGKIAELDGRLRQMTAARDGLLRAMDCPAADPSTCSHLRGTRR